MAYDKTNTGSIEKNARKEKDSHPDIAGSINVEGIEYWINGWLKKNGSTGKSFYSLSVKPKETRAQEIRDQHQGRADQRPLDYDDDAEIPF